MPAAAVFVGVCTLDLTYLTAQPMGTNNQQRALDFQATAGGGATNAAITFAALGGTATLITAIGQGPLGDAVRNELTGLGVTVHDTTPDDPAGPPVACAVIEQATGHRAIVSRGGGDHTPRLNEAALRSLLVHANLLVIDDYRPTLAVPAATIAHAAAIPVIMDASEWNPHTETLLHLTDIAICGEQFTIPTNPQDTLGALLGYGPTFTAATHGSKPLQWQTPSDHGTIPVPSVTVVDTLGAGDIFHGAYAHALATHLDNGHELTDTAMVNALHSAAQIASASCAYFGPRNWIKTLQHA